MNIFQKSITIKYLSYSLLVVSFFPYAYFTFFNVDPLHDGWFTAPGVAISNGATPYKDVITSYGWVSPALFSIIIKVAGFHLIYFRLIGLLLHALICITFFLTLRHFLDSRKASVIISMWLLINLGQITRDENSLPAWSFWPNQIIVLISLLAIYFFVVKKDFRVRTIVTLGTFAGLAPWVRAQGLLTLVVVFLIVTHHSWSTKSRESFRVWIYFISALIFSAGIPLAVIIKNAAFKNFRWQTFDMPRTGEWVGMPNPITWIFQNIGLSFSFLVLVMGLALMLTKFKSNQIVSILAFSFCLLVLWKTNLNSENHSTNYLYRKLQSFAYLYVNYNFFTFPLLVLLGIFILVITYKGLHFVKYRQEEHRSEFTIYTLSVPAVTLIYYNFGHLWGVAPLILLTLIAFYIKSQLEWTFIRNFISVLVTYSIVVSGLAIPQIYGRIMNPSFSYSAPGLELMRGQDLEQVKVVSRSVEVIGMIPRGEKVFFLCQYALYSVSKNRFVSDNIFYGTSMTKFNLRPESYKSPQAGTRYLVYCPGSNTINVDELPGKWVLANFSSDASYSGVQVYKRSTR